jgi:folate-binding protein YgfZ
MEDVTENVYRIEMHGPRALEVLGVAAGRADGLALEPGHAAAAPVAGYEIDVARSDTTGEIGLVLFVPRDGLTDVWDALLGAGEPEGEAKAAPRFVRPVGWFAYNIARIEAGTPLFHVDFGPENLPHETGVLRERVCFTKGCYLGQEVVARMESLGRPKQQLVGLKVEGVRLPMAEAQVFAGDDEGLGTPIGVVTSSTPSPMLGAKPIAFAMVKSAHADPGTSVRVMAEGEAAPATVGPLRFWFPDQPGSSEGEADVRG